MKGFLNVGDVLHVARMRTKHGPIINGEVTGLTFWQPIVREISLLDGAQIVIASAPGHGAMRITWRPFDEHEHTYVVVNNITYKVQRRGITE